MSEKIRLDKWLWHARFFKTRGLATRFCSGGSIRIDGDRIQKPHFGVRVGHILTFRYRNMVKVVKIRALGFRRGPAAEASGLYEDLSDESRIPRLK